MQEMRAAGSDVQGMAQGEALELIRYNAHDGKFQVGDKALGILRQIRYSIKAAWLKQGLACSFKGTAPCNYSLGLHAGHP